MTTEMDLRSAGIEASLLLAFVFRGHQVDPYDLPACGGGVELPHGLWAGLAFEPACGRPPAWRAAVRTAATTYEADEAEAPAEMAGNVPGMSHQRAHVLRLAALVAQAILQAVAQPDLTADQAAFLHASYRHAKALFPVPVAEGGAS